MKLHIFLIDLMSSLHESVQLDILMGQPAATAVPITLVTFGPIACISRKLKGSTRCPSNWETLAAISYRGNTGGTDQRINFPVGRQAHELAEQIPR